MCMMTDQSQRINYERAKLVVGLSLLAIGLLISIGAWNLTLWHQGETRQGRFVEYLPSKNNPILFPTSFNVFEVPDYLLRYLVIGVFITSVGITILASTFWKRIESTNVRV